MHVSDPKLEMSKEVFHILLDVMEKHFAALKLLDSDSDEKLTRSISYSELPSAQRFQIQQSYSSVHPSGLVRQYSCEQILDKTANTRQLKLSEVVLNGNNECRKVWQTTVPYSEPNPVTSWQFCEGKNVIQAPKLMSNEVPNEIEYMDVEVIDSPKKPKVPSYHPPSGIDTLNKDEFLPNYKVSEKIDTEEKQETLTKKEVNKNTYESVRSRLRPLVVKPEPCVKRKRNMCWCNCVCLCMLSISVAIIALLLNPKLPVCNHSELFSNASVELQQKVYGQEEAISSIVHFLNQNFSYLKVLCLIGGTGVGKSYTSDILMRNFPFKTKVLVHDIAMNQNLDARLLSSLHSYQLLILENLKMKNLDVLASVLDALSSQKVCITVLAIINVEDVNDHLSREVDLRKSSEIIEETFSKKNIDMVIAPYEPLKDETLNMCITEAARVSNLKLTESQTNEVKEILLSTGAGCKGAFAKVQVVGGQYVPD